MKTKIKFPILLLIFATGFIFSSCEKDAAEMIPQNTKSQINTIQVTEGAISSVDLIAGQNMIAGKVSVSFDNTNLYVSYNTMNDWFLSEVHLWVGPDLSLMPQTNSGNPKIGQFPYKASGLNGSTSYTFTIPLSAFGGYDNMCSSVLYLAAHASLYKTGSGGAVQTETAWGNGSQMNEQGSWAMYFLVQFMCEDDYYSAGPCETAFGYGPLTFIDAGLTSSRWGWIYTLSTGGTFETPLYAGAGQNNINNGLHVGTVTYSYNGSGLKVEFETFGGYSLSETHVYASSAFPTTISPGLFGHSNSDPDPKSDAYFIELNGGPPVYVIAHAVVCSKQAVRQ
ncbi:MAG: hypothetical protein A2W93_03880 [Bacteroidetes bacterium GWF2_43_63]|nr:MAG: hypothetical protein A2W94_15820 [Bacteroidetes bacterium GWE2_42_42]OFY55365.1 MAG: hypothetical protein A2W93_03880 [Bacteroidetes bacterium GWF2_43_63]HBG70643.1 hypothetical protein [Bacteroidales bacterium]HCB61763.1 hypothetical protein [Bacteroidales bacterium]HCY22641.1 hypothetical protein [Bacteroidales bacterium]